ncbi:MAG: serine protease [Thermoanaerobaculia bacterium]
MRPTVFVCLSTLLLAAAPARAGKEIPEATPGPSEVGQARTLDVVPDLDAAIETDGYRLWTHAVRIAGATFLKPHFVDVNLRAGDVLVVRSRTGHVVEEIRGRGPKGLGSFWGLSAFGDELRFELRFRHDDPPVPFRVDRAIVGDVDPFPADGPESICTPADFEDVFCYQGDAGKWANVTASVGVMSVGGSPTSGLFCSGSNVSPNNYLLTNQHCIENQSSCDGAEFVFKYYRTGCNDGSPTTLDWVGFRCDQVVAQSPYNGFCEPNLDNLDFTLASVLGDPATAFGFVEPDPIPITDGEDIYIIQHPAGRPHEITHGGGANVDADGTTFRYYDTLDTEGGSSGSPIFRDSDDKLVGLHHCGGCSTPGTGNRGMLMSDIHPLIADFLCTDTVALAAAGFDPLEQVSGNGDAVLDWGEIWQFSPRVRNTACTGDAFNVHADLAPNAGNVGTVQMLDTEAQFGTVAAGTTALSASPVRFVIGADFPCGSSFALDLVDLQADGTVPLTAPELLTAEIGEEVFTIYFEEHFDAESLADWTIVDGGTGAQTWTDANPGNRALALAEPFAIADADENGSGNTMDEEMISEIVDLSAATVVRLQFQHDFNWYSPEMDEQADVDVRSAATGGAWVNVVNFSGGDASGLVDVDVSSQAAGQSDVQIRFHYYQAGFEWWWAVDDVNLLNSEFVCDLASDIFSDGFESGDTSAWSAAQP